MHRNFFAFKSALSFVTIILFLASAQASQQVNALNSFDNAKLQRISEKFEEFTGLFNQTTGSCSKLSRYSFTKERRLISVARSSVYESNQGYDYPMDFDILYLGDLNEQSRSFSEALRILNGARQSSFVRRYFERQNDQDALDQLWIFKSEFQRQLAGLSMKSRILVYTGVAGNSFGKTEFVVLLDPKEKELALFQAGWCE